MKQITETLSLLRFPFSLFLLPVSLLSYYHIQPELDFESISVLIIWHLLVYPSSNGYNSYHDKDEGPIGGLKAPPKPSKLLLYAANCLDLLALCYACFLDFRFGAFVFGYILFSRLYSNRTIRLKKFPIMGFLVVFLFQGAWVFCANCFAFGRQELLSTPSVFLAAVASSCLIGTIYPLTQVYQHEADAKDGVVTLSLKLGVKGTFVFSGLLFSIAAALLYFSFYYQDQVNNFLLFMVILMPATVYFLVWAFRTFQNHQLANFKNTMIMLVLSSMLNNICFLILLF